MGPRLMVQIGFDPAYKAGAGMAPDIPETPFMALVDTGASLCFVDTNFALANGLPLVDRERVIGAFGASDVNVYLAQMHIPHIPFTVHGRFAGADLSGLGCIALIGRAPVLTRCRMVYDGPSGSVSLEAVQN